MECERNCRFCGIPLENKGLWEIKLERRPILSLEQWPLGVMVYTCPQCGKLEFYDAEKLEMFQEETIRCPSCYTKYPKTNERCPYCQHINETMTQKEKEEI